MKKLALISVLAIYSSLSMATYNANMSGVLTDVITYTDADYIYLKLDNQPTSHPNCNPSFFVIATDVSLQMKQMLLSRLLTAYALNESVKIGFDNAGNCAHGYIRVHRVG